ncbi:hypothetical protein ACH5RR_009017 [Cinchona calisaya]|uniref:GPI ethanolamine phosphate transferase 1 C-terminal domain-containing protein n=1 Tax=Cinchona calisaya TaxID=153742 RepID=A0ABD3AGW5_9GENT
MIKTSFDPGGSIYELDIVELNLDYNKSFSDSHLDKKGRPFEGMEKLDVNEADLAPHRSRLHDFPSLLNSIEYLPLGEAGTKLSEHLRRLAFKGLHYFWAYNWVVLMIVTTLDYIYWMAYVLLQSGNCSCASLLVSVQVHFSACSNIDLMAPTARTTKKKPTQNCLLQSPGTTQKVLLGILGEYQKGIQTLDYDIVTYDYQSDAKIDTEKGDVNGMTSDLDSHLEAKEVLEPKDASSSLEEFESLTNIPTNRLLRMFLL